MARELRPYGQTCRSAERDWLSLTVIPDDWRQDSMLLIEADGKRVLFANDTNTDRCEWPKDIDILACQYSGACYYPSAYEYPPDVMAEKIEAARIAQMDMLVEKVRLCGAKAYIPCAGPAYHAGQKIGPGSPFPVWAEVEREFRAVCPDVEIMTDGLLMAEPDVIERHAMLEHDGFVEFRMPKWLHDKVKAGECSFEDALSTYSVHIRREPDVFDPIIHRLRGRQLEREPA